ncbi:hypothetical protein DL96DRAFT_1563204 [Flagelloscypha sp. PMI_526]|nr:hypothetical protein DL96DRAFT_1563204 [Flagelloscypha sp. PMI_526]
MAKYHNNRFFESYVMVLGKRPSLEDVRKEGPRWLCLAGQAIRDIGSKSLREQHNYTNVPEIGMKNPFAERVEFVARIKLVGKLKWTTASGHVEEDEEESPDIASLWAPNVFMHFRHDDLVEMCNMRRVLKGVAMVDELFVVLHIFLGEVLVAGLALHSVLFASVEFETPESQRVMGSKGGCKSEGPKTSFREMSQNTEHQTYCLVSLRPVVDDPMGSEYFKAELLLRSKEE